MNNLKELLESHINDNVSALDKEQLNQTFKDAAEFQRFRATFLQRIAQQKQRHQLKVALYTAIAVLTLLGTAFVAKKSYDKAHEKPLMQKDIAMIESSTTVDGNFDKAYHQTLSNVRKDVKVDDVSWKTAYYAGHFAETAQIIERIGAEASPEATYTLAMCYIQLKQYDMAVAPFNRIIDSDPQQLKTFTPEALWLLANVYIKLNRQAEAKTLLQQFVNENATHAPEAKVLLNK